MDAGDAQEIRQLFDDYLRMYASRDDRLTGCFSEDFSGFTGGGDFLVKDREEWVAVTRQDFAQVKDPLRIELKDLAIQSLSDTIAVTTGFFTIHLPIEDHILSRETARLVLIFRRESAGWRICHSGISIPYQLVGDGEVYPLEELEERNRFLEELVSERTRQLSEAKKAAEAANLAKSQFLATMSHEMRTPLNALVGFSALARNTTDPDNLAQYHAILEQSSRSLTDLVDGILDMSKIEAGRMELEAAPCHLRQLIGSLRDQIRPLAAQKALAFEVAVADDVPAWVLGDPVRLRQIFANLLSNAVKFTDRGSVSFAAGRAACGGLLRFEVRDTGIGLPEAGREQLFQPFRQLDPTITRRFGGTGLGLAIVHSLVGMMKGGVTVDSREGEGSCFVVELPLPETEPASKGLAAPVALAPCAILVVEDNGFNRRLLGDLLTSWGQEVTLAENGRQALQFVEQQRFDLLFLDIRMPVLDGMEVARRIRRQERERSERPVPIVAVTADADIGTREACFAAGIDAVLAKPVVPEQLAATLAVHCARAEAAPAGQELALSAQVRGDLGDDPERARRFRAMLRQDLDEELQKLEAALEAGAGDDLGRAAHTLKGLCGHLASREPAERAAWLQHNARSAPREQLRQAIDQLREFCRGLLAPDAKEEKP